MKHITNKHSQSCSSTIHVPTSTQRLRDLCWYVCQWRAESAPTLETWIVEIEHVRHTGRGKKVGAGDLQQHIKSWGYELELSSKNLFRHEEHRVSGMTHGDDFVVTGQTDRIADLKNKMAWVYTIKTKVISHGSTGSIKTLNRRLHWGKRGLVYQHDPRHVDVLVKDFGLEHGNLRQFPVHDVTDDIPEALNQTQSSNCGAHVARCLLFSQDRADITFMVNELCQIMSNATQQSIATWPNT